VLPQTTAFTSLKRKICRLEEQPRLHGCAIGRKLKGDETFRPLLDFCTSQKDSVCHHCCGDVRIRRNMKRLFAASQAQLFGSFAASSSAFSRRARALGDEVRLADEPAFFRLILFKLGFLQSRF
jgi:hypothetical protein